MRIAAVLAVIGMAGCDRLFGLQPVGGPAIDAPGDMKIDMPIDTSATIAIDAATAGGFHTCALRGGVAHCWGQGMYGQLGYGNPNAIGDNELARAGGDVPVGVAVKSISAGGLHTCAVTVADSVRCWGNGENGRLGYANTTTIGDTETAATAGNVDVGSPVLVVVAGGTHTCAITSNHNVRCWGSGAFGQLGYGIFDVGDNETPAQQGDVNVGFAVDAVALGNVHTCAMSSNSALRCWGSGGSGRLGYGNLNNVTSPTSAGDVSIGGLAVQVVAGEAHTCVRLTGGDVKCWGRGSAGALGYGNTNDIGDNETPASQGAVDLGGSAIDIAAGSDHTCAVLSDNTLRCWGANASGQLGLGTTDMIGDNELPRTVGPVDVGGAVMRVWAGGNHTCALLATGAVRCWGAGADGELGYGNLLNIGDGEAPATAGDVPAF